MRQVRKVNEPKCNRESVDLISMNNLKWSALPRSFSILLKLLFRLLVLRWLRPATGDNLSGHISLAVSHNSKMSVSQPVGECNPAPTKSHRQGQAVLPLNVVFYGIHTPSIDARILRTRPQYVIINPPHGLWGEMVVSARCQCLNKVAEYKAAGIKVIGYITAGYEGRGSAGEIDLKWYTLEMNQKLIKNMAEIDHVDGVFIDECSPFPNRRSQTYLKTLTDLAHSYDLIIWGNVGEAQFSSWFFRSGGFDLMQSNENWCGQGLSQVQHDWRSRISVLGSSPSHTAQDALALTIDAWQKGLAYCYIDDSGYTSIAPWFEEYVALLRNYDGPLCG